MLDLDMSPYGPFVWGAYALSAIALIGLSAVIVQRARSVVAQLARLEAET